MTKAQLNKKRKQKDEENQLRRTAGMKLNKQDEGKEKKKETRNKIQEGRNFRIFEMKSENVKVENTVQNRERKKRKGIK